MAKRPFSGEDRERLTDALGEAVAQGADLIASIRASMKAHPTRATQSKEIERAHKQAVARYESEVRAHRNRLRRASLRMPTMTTTAAVAGTVTVIGAATGGIPLAVAGAAVTGVAAVSAWRSRTFAQDAPPAPTAIVPAPPPPRLRSGAPGEPDARRLLRIRAQLTAIIPAVRTLHPEAGLELARADAEAGPALNALVQRLEVLDQMMRSLPGTQAAATAAVSAGEITARLKVGVDTYDALMSAAAQMLSAPDMSRDADEVLAPAVDAMHAYAHGLRASADVFSPDSPS